MPPPPATSKPPTMPMIVAPAVTYPGAPASPITQAGRRTIPPAGSARIHERIVPAIVNIDVRTAVNVRPVRTVIDDVVVRPAVAKVRPISDTRPSRSIARPISNPRSVTWTSWSVANSRSIAGAPRTIWQRTRPIPDTRPISRSSRTVSDTRSVTRTSRSISRTTSRTVSTTGSGRQCCRTIRPQWAIHP